MLISGGKLLNAGFLNKYRKIGRYTKISLIYEIFNILEVNGFGERDMNGNFKIYDNILHIISESDIMKENMINMGITLSMLQEALHNDNKAPLKKRRIELQSQQTFQTVPVGLSDVLMQHVNTL